MFIFILITHIIISILLIVIILMQSGRGGGLTETFSGVESIFGTKTNIFLVRATAILAVLFLISCLSLAYMSKMRGKSLIQQQATPIEKKLNQKVTTTTDETGPATKRDTEESSKTKSENIIKEQKIEKKDIKKIEETNNQ
jgi:preprotein translocase subunit SecG